MKIHGIRLLELERRGMAARIVSLAREHNQAGLVSKTLFHIDLIPFDALPYDSQLHKCLELHSSRYHHIERDVVVTGMRLLSIQEPHILDSSRK